MSRARTLASILGSDGALNVADLAGLAAVASSGSASDLSTGTLPIARIGANAIDNSKLATTGLDASKLTTGTLDVARIADGAIADTKFTTALNQRLTSPFVKKQVVNRRMILGCGLYSNSTEYFRNDTSTCASVYGPFGYGVPAVQTGAERRFRIYAVYGDGSTSQGDPQLIFRPNDSTTNQVTFTLQSTWGSSANQRDWYSNEVVGTPWGDHAVVHVSGSGTANYAMRFHYVELQALDVWS